MDGISKYQCDQSKGMSICERCYRRFDEHYEFEYSICELIICPTSIRQVEERVKTAAGTMVDMVNQALRHVLENDEFVQYLTGNHINLDYQFEVNHSEKHPGYCIHKYNIKHGRHVEEIIEYPHVSKYVVDEACRVAQIKAGLEKIIAAVDVKNNPVLKKI